MSSPKPPTLATWLLEHLAIGPNKDAVAGDLLEQFARRPSAGWYWRQVPAAIALGLWRERYILWLAAGCTLVWIALLPLFYRHIWRFIDTHGLYLYEWRWPLSEANAVALFSVVNGLPLPVVLCVYLAMMKSLTLRRLIRGLLVGVLALPLSVVLNMGLLSVMWTWVPRNVAYYVSYPVVSLPMFVALLFSMLAVRTDPPSARNAKATA